MRNYRSYIRATKIENKVAAIPNSANSLPTSSSYPPVTYTRPHLFSLWFFRFSSAPFRDCFIVHPSEMLPKIIQPSKAVASLSIASILRAIDGGPFPVDVLDMTREGSERTTTVFTLSPTGFCRRLMSENQHQSQWINQCSAGSSFRRFVWLTSRGLLRILSYHYRICPHLLPLRELRKRYCTVGYKCYCLEQWNDQKVLRCAGQRVGGWKDLAERRHEGGLLESSNLWYYFPRANSCQPSIPLILFSSRNSSIPRQVFVRFIIYWILVLRRATHTGSHDSLARRQTGQKALLLADYIEWHLKRNKCQPCVRTFPNYSYYDLHSDSKMRMVSFLRGQPIVGAHVSDCFPSMQPNLHQHAGPHWPSQQ